jgi:transcriptional regulator with XRE-family HTH domain
MNAIKVKTRQPSIGNRVRKLRLSRLLTQQELADEAGVSMTEVNSFEQGLPLPLDSKRKILKELWSEKEEK